MIYLQTEQMYRKFLQSATSAAIAADVQSAQNQQRAVALQGSSTKNKTKFYKTLQACAGGCRCKYMYQGTVRHVCALCTRSPTRGTCVTCGRMCCRGCIEDASRQCWVCLGYEERWKKTRRARQRRRRRATNQRTGASERRRRLWAWGQNAEQMWAVLCSEGWVGVEWEMCEWEVARRREARWMQEARDRRQWLAQARWLEELWRVAFEGPIWRRGEDTTVSRSPGPKSSPV